MATTTQNQAMFALLFLYKEVLGIELERLGGKFTSAKQTTRVPVVLTREEVAAVLSHLSGVNWIMANLLYGAGLRLKECLRLRVKDLDFGYRQITVRDGKGGKDRFTILPEKLVERLQKHLESVKSQHERDLTAGLGAVLLPFAFDGKHSNAACEWKWQYVFPSSKISRDPRTNKLGRHHLSESGLQKAVKTGLNKAAVAQTRELSYFASFICDASFAKRLGHPHDSGFARTQGTDDDDDLHARFTIKSARREKSG